MILGSHNSWSYLPSKKWWMKPFTFIAKCQDKNILTQNLLYNVNCFDLRIRFNKKGKIVIAHGFMEYKYSKEDLIKDLNFLNLKNCVVVRILHEVRTKKQYTKESTSRFINFCIAAQQMFPNIKFWCGRNLYNWNIEYNFSYNPSCEEKYSSVCSPKLIDDWFPRLFAKYNNKKILKEGTDKDILLIDFVNYG